MIQLWVCDWSKERCFETKDEANDERHGNNEKIFVYLNARLLFERRILLKIFMHMFHTCQGERCRSRVIPSFSSHPMCNVRQKFHLEMDMEVKIINKNLSLMSAMRDGSSFVASRFFGADGRREIGFGGRYMLKDWEGNGSLQVC